MLPKNPGDEWWGFIEQPYKDTFSDGKRVLTPRGWTTSVIFEVKREQLLLTANTVDQVCSQYNSDVLAVWGKAAHADPDSGQAQTRTGGRDSRVPFPNGMSIDGDGVSHPNKPSCVGVRIPSCGERGGQSPTVPFIFAGIVDRKLPSGGQGPPKEGLL